MGAVWEYVNVILQEYTSIGVPNLYITSFHVMYIDVLRWTIIMGPRRTTGGSLAALRAMLPHGLCGPRLLLAGRQPLPGLHPLEQGGFAVANGPADRGVRGAVAAHARFGQPGQADLQQLGRFLGREKDDDRHGRPLRRRAAGERRLRGHFPSSREIARNDSDLRVRSALVASRWTPLASGAYAPERRINGSEIVKQIK
jgi:hypothetical protein